MINKKVFKFRFIMVSVTILAVFALLLAGCGKKDAGTPESGAREERQNAPGVDEKEPGSGTEPAGIQQKVTLYFSDDLAMYLVPEERVVSKGDEKLEEIIIRELIKGPQKEGLGQTIPEGTELLSVSVADGIAEVDFSKEFKSNHWGGSAGETMTLYSVVNSLCALPGIEKVQFLLEGEKQESILGGNMDTSVPLEPDYNLVAK